MGKVHAQARPVDLLLAEYGDSHQNPFNKKIHWIAVPVIFWTVLALLWSLPVPALFAGIAYVNWATILLVVTVAYYMWLSVPLALGMLAFALVCIIDIAMFEAYMPVSLWKTAIAVFVVAWVFQFWGHHVEGKKPSFFKDVQFLLVGPAWLMSFIYKRLGINY
jgi:uncharacterized membrane protein YGL010W